MIQPPKPYREKRPWGEFIEFARNTPSTVKILTVNADQSFSLQTHAHRDEFWHVISGNGTITNGSSSFSIEPGMEHFIPRGTEHRIHAGSIPVVVLEVSFGDFDEHDISRLDDMYGRT